MEIDAATLAAALDPWGFVRRRTIPGGPAPETVGRALDAASRRLTADRAWLEGTQAHLATAAAERTHRRDQLIALADERMSGASA